MQENVHREDTAFNIPYKIISILYDVNYKLYHLTYHTGSNNELVNVSKLCTYIFPDKFHLWYQEKKTNVEVI